MPDAHEPILARRLTALFVWGAAIALGLWFFAAVTHVLLLLLASVTIAAALQPVERAMPGKRWAKGAVVGTLFWLVTAGALAAMAWQLKAPIQQQIRQWPQIEHNLNQSLARLGRWLGLQQPLTMDRVVDQAARWLLGGDGSGIALAHLADDASGLVLALLILVFGSIYLLATRPDELIAPVTRRLSPHRARAVRDSLWALEAKMRWWLLATVFSMALSGGLAYAGLLVIQMRFALPVALLTGVSQVVPTLGPSAATIVALLLAATQGTGTLIAVAVLFAVILTVESNVITPLIMKQAVRVPPVVSLFTVVLWARLLGPLGLVLAIPIDLVIWSFFAHFVPTRGEVVQSPAEPRR